MAEPRFPEAFETSDAAAIDAQRRFILSTRLQLGLLVVAGVAGLFTLKSQELDVAALVGGSAFAAAALLRIRVLRQALHRLWYEARAAAESIKTLSWRYAVGGEPFSREAQQAAAAYVDQVKAVLGDLPALRGLRGDAQPTEWMEDLRATPLERRRDSYLGDRIEDQARWYAAKSEWNRRRARRWGLAILALQVGGATGAFLKGFGVVDFDVFDLAAALVGAAAAWLETRQHASLASAYAVAADELREIARLIPDQTNEVDWASFVSDAEEAISREHTMWKASSSQRKPASLA